MSEETIIERHLRQSLIVLGGWYDCPKDPAGKRLGPLVGYAGRYFPAGCDPEKQWVGETYVNCAVLEEHPATLLEILVEGLCPKLFGPVEQHSEHLVFCGAPEGGKAIAELLALHFRGTRYVFPEKKTTKLADAISREATKLIWGRHKVNPGDVVVLVEDLLNNFSTTDQLIELVQAAGGNVAAIAALVNRSLNVDTSYAPSTKMAPIPILAILRKPIPEYTQEDPRVRDDIAAGNIVLKPKEKWSELVEAMRAHPQE